MSIFVLCFSTSHLPLSLGVSAHFHPTFSLAFHDTMQTLGNELSEHHELTLTSWNLTYRVERSSSSRQNMLSFLSFLYLEKSLEVSMFSITMEILSQHLHTETSLFQQYLTGEYYSKIWFVFVPTHCLSNNHTKYPPHTRVCLCLEETKREKEGSRAKSPSIHWASFRGLNNRTRWCHDSHCQTTETDTHHVCGRDFMSAHVSLRVNVFVSSCVSCRDY